MSDIEHTTAESFAEIALRSETPHSLSDRVGRERNGEVTVSSDDVWLDSSIRNGGGLHALISGNADSRSDSR
jgi:hypothetical protein